MKIKKKKILQDTNTAAIRKYNIKHIDFDD